MSATVFTIGHSTHTQAQFIALLQQYRITAVCDVRSMPYSRFNPQFNREELKNALWDSGIVYVFLGRELGARSEDPFCFENGRIRYERLARTDLFRQGLDRVQQGIDDYRIALMCAEKEPLDCHRTILVARHLIGRGLDVQHIHANGEIESHSRAIDRLARMFELPDEDLFRSHAEILMEAYERQEERIAFQPAADDEPAWRTAG